MPIGTGAGAALGFAVFDPIGDPIYFRIVGMQITADGFLQGGLSGCPEKRPEMAAELDVLFGSQGLIPNHQQATRIQPGLADIFGKVLAHGLGNVQSSDFCAQDRR